MELPNRLFLKGALACLPLLCLTACFCAVKAAPRANAVPLSQPPQTVPDSRLTVSGEFRSIVSLLTAIEAQTGSKTALRAQGQAGWSRVLVFAQGTPPNTIVDGLAALFGYQWTSRQRTRVLTQAGRARAYEDRLWREHLRKAGAPLFQLARYSRTPADRWKQRMEALQGAEPEDLLLQNANLKALSQTSMHASLELLDTLTYQQQDVLLLEEQVVIPGSSLSTRQEQIVRRMDQFPGLRYDHQERLLSPKQVQENLEQQLTFYRGVGITLTIERNEITGAVKRYPHWYTVPPSLSSVFRFPVRGCPYPREGVQADTPAVPESDQAVKDSARVPFPAGFKIPESSPDEPLTWARILKALSEALPSDYVLLSDNFEPFKPSFVPARLQGAPKPLPELELSGKTLEEGLDALCESQGRLWWRDGKVLFFRSRTWFVQQRYEVPPPVLAQLTQRANRLQTTPHTSQTIPTEVAELLSLLAGLTREQLIGLQAGNATSANDVGSGAFYARQVSSYLRFCQTLTPAQQQQALTDDGLAFAKMTPVQRQAFVSLAFNVSGLWATRKPEDLCLTVQWSAGLQSVPGRDTGGQSTSIGKEAALSMKNKIQLNLWFGFMPQAPHAAVRVFLPADTDTARGTFPKGDAIR